MTDRSHRDTLTLQGVENSHVFTEKVSVCFKYQTEIFFCVCIGVPPLHEYSRRMNAARHSSRRVVHSHERSPAVRVNEKGMRRGAVGFPARPPLSAVRALRRSRRFGRVCGSLLAAASASRPCGVCRLVRSRLRRPLRRLRGSPRANTTQRMAAARVKPCGFAALAPARAAWAVPVRSLRSLPARLPQPRQGAAFAPLAGLCGAAPRF